MRRRRRGRRGEGSIVERDGKWLARWSQTTGGRRTQKAKTFTLKGDAEWWLRTAHRHGEVPDVPVVADYLRDWLGSKRRIAASTATQYREHIELHLIPALGGYRVTDLRKAHIEAWVDAPHYGPTGKPLSSATVGKILTTLRSALEAGVPHELPDNPARRVEAPKVAQRVPRVIGTAEAARILDAVTGTWVEAIARFLFGSALRIGEAVSINQGDIDWRRNVVQIRASKTHIRQLAVTDDAMDALRLAIWQAPRRGPKEPVFFSPRPRHGSKQRDRLLPSSVTHALPRIMEAAGIDRITSHTLRHAFATVALEQELPIESIADQLGHRSLAMTRRYAHVTNELRRATLTSVGESVRSKRSQG